MDIDKLKNLTILYAEDDDLVRSSVESMLKRRLKKVVSASNGSEALKSFLELKDEIDVIITDIEMPFLNGIELIDEIRKFSNVPIVVITAFSDETHRTEKADYFLIKPVLREDILEALLSSVKKAKK